MLSLKTESDVLKEVASALRAHRSALGWRQVDLAEKSGVAIATLRRFERTGKIGFNALTKMLVSLGLADRFLAALKPPIETPKSITAFLAEGQAVKPPQRVRLKRRTN